MHISKRMRASGGESLICSGRNKLEFMRINTKIPCDKSNSIPLLQIIIYTSVCLTPKHQSTHMSKPFGAAPEPDMMLGLEIAFSVLPLLPP